VLSSSAQADMGLALYRSEGWSYKGCVTGTVSFSALSRDPFIITQGHVDLFVTDGNVSDAVILIYNLELLGIDGRKYSMHGYKRIDSRITLSLIRAWTATTTLFTTISQRDGTQMAKGILRLSLRGFVSELMSLRCSSGLSFMQRNCVKASFASFFARQLMPYVFSPFRALHYAASTQDYSGDWEKARPSETRVQSADGIEFCMKTWEPFTTCATEGDSDCVDSWRVCRPSDFLASDRISKHNRLPHFPRLSLLRTCSSLWHQRRSERWLDCFRGTT
jgi:hypothetical protein